MANTVHYIEALYDELRARLVSALPYLTTGGVWVSQHVNSVPFENLTLPFGGIHIEQFNRTTGWAAGCMIFEVMAHLYVAKNQEWDSLDLARDIEVLRDSLEFMPLSNGQTLSVEEFGWGDDLPPNQVFILKNNNSRAGRVTVKLLVGTQGQVSAADPE